MKGMCLMSFDNLNEIRIKVDNADSRVCLFFIYIFADKEKYCGNAARNFNGDSLVSCVNKRD